MEECIRGSGNVFADLGLPNPEERLAKAELLRQITRIIKEKKLSQVQTAERLGLDVPDLSALLDGKLAGFSMARLLGFLMALDYDVEIHIAPKPARARRKARTTISSTATK